MSDLRRATSYIVGDKSTGFMCIFTGNRQIPYHRRPYYHEEIEISEMSVVDKEIEENSINVP